MITSLKILAAVATLGGMAAFTQPAKADHIRVGVGLGLNFVAPTYIAPTYIAPTYVAPVYTPAYAPAYAPAPVVTYSAPAPVAAYGAPTYYYPQPTYYYPQTVVYPPVVAEPVVSPVFVPDVSFFFGGGFGFHGGGYRGGGFHGGGRR